MKGQISYCLWECTEYGFCDATGGNFSSRRFGNIYYDYMADLVKYEEKDPDRFLVLRTHMTNVGL